MRQEKISGVFEQAYLKMRHNVTGGIVWSVGYYKPFLGASHVL
jgi:hypothetical protein